MVLVSFINLDAGAEANIVPLDLFKPVCSSLLRPTSTVLRDFGNVLIKPLGWFNVAVRDKRLANFCCCFISRILYMSPNTVKSPALYLSDRQMTIRRLEN